MMLKLCKAEQNLSGWLAGYKYSAWRMDGPLYAEHYKKIEIIPIYIDEEPCFAYFLQKL